MKAVPCSVLALSALALTACSTEKKAAVAPLPSTVSATTHYYKSATASPSVSPTTVVRPTTVSFWEPWTSKATESEAVAQYLSVVERANYVALKLASDGKRSTLTQEQRGILTEELPTKCSSLLSYSPAQVSAEIDQIVSDPEKVAQTGMSAEGVRAYTEALYIMCNNPDFQAKHMDEMISKG